MEVSWKPFFNLVNYCSDGDLHECCFPPREVTRIHQGFNKIQRRLTIAVAADLWRINRLGLGCIVACLAASTNKASDVLQIDRVWFHQRIDLRQDSNGNHCPKINWIINVLCAAKPDRCVGCCCMSRPTK
ncbi:hypothetical protein ZWY2020_049820 [Hordeum vulgare]|nr:hypothetical protein ZWY2020_049820 [Hordeum vulgare]